jgi:hypothetical protein
LHLPLELPNAAELGTFAINGIAGRLAGLSPALRACRLSLADGMTVGT